MMHLSFFKSAATLLLACHTCSIVSAQPASAPPSRQAEVLARDVGRLAAKIERNIKTVEEDIEALNARKQSLHWVLEILKEVENNPAEYDNGKALYRIGSLFEDGAEDMNIESDPSEAVLWYRKAAIIHKHIQSQKTLGLLYLWGKKGKASSVHHNHSEAAVWIKKAAEQGDAEAQYLLAVLLAQGEGVKRDEAAAEQWLEKAEQGGLKNARSDFEKSKRELTAYLPR